MSKLLVTGGSGYLGSVLVEQLLDSNHAVEVVDLGWFDRSGPRIDARSLDAEALRGIDTVIHLAALSDASSCRQHRHLVDDINTQLCVDLAALAAEAGVRTFLMASSAAVYGTTSGPVDEATATRPIDAYAQSKLAAEERAGAVAVRNAMTFVAIRLGTLFGVSPAMRSDLVVNRLVGEALTDGIIRLTSSGTTHRSFVHVADAASAFAHLAHAQLPAGFHALNCGHQNTTVLDIARVVAHELEATVVVDDRLDPSDYSTDSSRLRSLGWSSRRNVRDGVRQMARVMHGAPAVAFRAATLARLQSEGRLDDRLAWCGASRSNEAARTVPLVVPFRLPPDELARFTAITTSITERSSYRVADRWSARASEFVNGSLGLAAGENDWSVTMFRSGTDALVRALAGLGVRAGDRVAIPDLAFHAVGGAVLGLGAVPVVVDVTEDDWCLDADALEATCASTSVDAVIAVDNYGTPCDWRRLGDVARHHGTPLIVDACESLGASRPDARLIDHADAVVISFSFTKPIHAAGMGGALIARTDAFVGHDPVRWTDAQYALPELNAAHLVLAWPWLEQSIDHLRATYARYAEMADAYGLTAQAEHGCSTRIHAPFLLPRSLATRRDEIIEQLGRVGVSARAQFRLQTDLLGLGTPPPVSRDVAARVVSLPSGAGICRDAVKYVIAETSVVLDRFGLGS